VTKTLDGVALDRRLREILISVTRANVISSAAAICELGFGARQAIDICDDVIRAKDEGRYPHGPQ
jgi:hypothetical protein